VIKHPIEAERRDAVAAGAIDTGGGGIRMACRLSRGCAGTISQVAAIACYTRGGNLRPGMIRVGTNEAGGGMAVTAVRAGVRMNTGRGVGYRGRFADGYRTIVAAGT